jgi:transposase
LSSILGEYGNEILSLVYAHCIDYKSVNQMTNWFERTDLNYLLDLENVTEESFLKAMDTLESNDSFKLQKRIFESVKKKFRINGTGILYDVTNTYMYGKKCPLGKPGKDKEGVKGRPLIQIGLGVTESEGIPIFHKVFDGNVHDARTLHDLITSIEDFKIKNGLIVFDRGITSKKNQRDLHLLKWKVICGLPIRESLKGFLRKFIPQHDFINFKNRVRLKKSVFYVITDSYKQGDVTGRIAICYNEQQRKDLRESRYDELSNAQKLLSSNKSIKPSLEKYFSKTGKLLMNKVQEAEEFDGYSVIFTTKLLSPEEIVRIYFDKDLVEKAFQSIKGVIKVQPIRHWLYNRVISHVFICYLAYLLLSLLKFRLKKIGISPIEALKEVETMYKVYMRDTKKGFRISRVVTLTKTQENILKAVDKKLLSVV